MPVIGRSVPSTRKPLTKSYSVAHSMNSYIVPSTRRRARRKSTPFSIRNVDVVLHVLIGVEPTGIQLHPPADVDAKILVRRGDLEAIFPIGIHVEIVAMAVAWFALFANRALGQWQ